MSIIKNITSHLDPRTFFTLPKEMQYQKEKNYKNYFSNPFEMKNTKETWNRDINIITKVFLTIITAFYEFCYLNPYKMTVGNRKTSRENQKIYLENKKIEQFNDKVKQLRNDKWTMAKHYAKGTLKLVGLVLAVAGVTYMLGTGLLLVGEYLKEIDFFRMVSPLVIKSGEILQKAGRYLFLSISVPTYSVFYELPKYLINNIPTLIQKTFDFVVNTFDYIYTKVIAPIASYLYEKVTSLFISFCEFVTPYLNLLVEKIQDFVNALIENILLPIWNKLIYPFFNATQEFIFWIGRQVTALIDFGVEMLKKITLFLENILLPIWNKLIYPLLNATRVFVFWIERQVSAFIDSGVEMIKKIGSLVLENILSPIWNKLIYPLLNTTQEFVFWIGRQVSAFIDFGVEMIKKIGSLVLENILTPIWNKLIYPLLNATQEFIFWIGRQVSTILEYSGKLINAISSIAFDYLIYPAYNGLAIVFQTTSQKAIAIISSLKDSTLESIAITIRATQSILNKFSFA